MFNRRQSILYFAPHQDDELLTMGVDIYASISNKNNVHVILCTDGSKSAVRNVLKNGKSCVKHEGEHIYDLTKEEFVAARDKEFTDSCIALGVPASNIHIPKERDIDGSLTIKNAKRIIKEYYTLYGRDALVCTISPYNGPSQHKDHKTLGNAAEELLKKGYLKQLKLFIEPYHLNKSVNNPRLLPVLPKIEYASYATAEKVQKAISSYSYWNPDEQRYAVGYHSVTTEFDDFSESMTSAYIMKKTRSEMNLFDKINWKYSVWLKIQKQKQLYYSMASCEKPELGNLKLVKVPVNGVDKYKDFCEKYSIAATERDIQRLKDGSSFWCLVSPEGDILTTGWMAYRQKFYISETDYGFDMSSSNSSILYNFVTKPEHRGNGYYGMLLRAMVHYSDEPENHIIYTSLDNIASQRGILKAGFEFEGELCSYDKSIKEYYKKAGFTSFTRKYQLWGMKVRK